MKYLVFLFLLFFIACTASPNTSIERSSLPSQAWPLTRDTHNLFPSRMHITGKVVQYEPGFTCGRTCSSAYFKIALTRPVGGYPRPYAYIAAPCFTKPANEVLNNTISMEAHKIAIDDTSCFFKPGSFMRANGITPWYQAGDYYVSANDTIKLR